MFPAPLAIIDLETTGMTATSDRITEIGIITVVNNEVIAEWSTLVNPECSIPEEIQSLTGISNAMVRDAPTFRELAQEVQQRLVDHVFVAHNARFDYGFVKNEFRRLDISFTQDVLCTVRLARKLYPGYPSYSLDALRERHHLTTDGRHRALGDARAAWQFIATALREHAPENVTAAVKSVLKMPSLPPQLPSNALDDLPEGPGVYTFYGINNMPIYIGKGVDIRTRVRSHFSSDHRSANDQRLSVEIMRIEYQETAGELGALLLESTLVKTRMPIRNHQLRRNQALCFVKLCDLNHLPKFLTLDDINFSDAESLSGLYGPFTTKASAKKTVLGLAADNGLCWNILSPQKKSHGACFAYQLHRCHGYCVGEETLSQHNVRLLTALIRYRFREWPVRGCIAVKEIHPDGKLEQVHVFIHWQYLGTANDEQALSQLLIQKIDTSFDADIYKLLIRYIDKGGRYTLIPSTRQVELDESCRDKVSVLNII